MTPSSRTLKLLGVVVSILSIAAVVYWALHQDAPTFPSSAGDLALLGLGVVGYFAACALRAERWHDLLAYNGAHASRRDCYALTAVGYMGNNVLPARGGDVLRTVLLRSRTDGDTRTVVGTLVAERILDVIVLFGLFAIVAFGLLHGIALPQGGRFAFAAAAIGALAVLGVAAAVVAHRRGVLARVVAWARPMAGATRNLRGRHGAVVLALTLGVWAGEVLVWWLVGRATGLDITPLQTCYVLSLSSIFVLIPSGPGYAGTFDAAIIFAATALDRTSAQALAYLVLLRFVVFIPITAAGLAALIGRYGGLRAARS